MATPPNSDKTSKFRLKADRKRLGEYKPVTRESNPESFRSPGKEAEILAKAGKALTALLQRSITGDAPPEDLVDDDDDEDLGEDDPAAVSAPADALDVDDPPWKRGQPKSQPLTYAVPIHANGSKVYRIVNFDVDFNDGNSVSTANKCRRQGLYRAGKKLGLPLKRQSTAGRQYTQANYDWIMDKYDSHAAANGGRRITMHQLAVQYNLHFPGEYRTQQSLASYVDRNANLKAKKEEYRS